VLFSDGLKYPPGSGAKRSRRFPDDTNSDGWLALAGYTLPNLPLRSPTSQRE
jgi:hypothetical protein